MKGWIVFIAVCTLTAAGMVPTERPQTAQPTTQKVSEYCAPQTPCAWSVYRESSKSVELFMENSYCTCEVGTTCQNDEDDWSIHTFVYRCRRPKPVNEPSEHPPSGPSALED